jgi:hypothetical protein
MSIRSRHRYQALAAVVVAGLLAAGCAQPSTERGSASGGGSTASTAPPASAPSSPTTTAPPLTSAPNGPTSAPPTTSPNGRAAVVVRGTVRKGVEPGCVLLDGQDKRAYLLIDGPNAQLKAGARVEVSGQPVDQIASFCGEGAALAVVSVRPLR